MVRAGRVWPLRRGGGVPGGVVARRRHRDAVASSNACAAQVRSARKSQVARPEVKYVKTLAPQRGEGAAELILFVLMRVDGVSRGGTKFLRLLVGGEQHAYPRDGRAEDYTGSANKGKVGASDVDYRLGRW